jgi:hypothetical protein
MATVGLKDKDGAAFNIDVTSNATAHNITLVGGNAVTAGAGAVAAGTPRVTLASDDPAVAALQLIDDCVIADDAAFTPATTKCVAVGFFADETASDSVTEGDLGAARMTLDRKIHVANEVESNSMRAGGTAVTPKFAAIAAATAAANTLLAAVPAKKIRVLSMSLTAGAAGNIYFTSAAAGAVIFGGSTNKINLAQNQTLTLPYSPVGHFETVAGELLSMDASSTGPFSGGFTYIEV